VQASHTYVGDLRFDLRKGDAEVLVIDHPGNSGCSGNDIDVVLDDDAFETIDDTCLAEGGGTPAIDGELQPDNPLDLGFAGQQLVGSWRLRVQDNNDEDVGTLDAWCLRFTYR
jgi:hypothetical protein